MGWSTYANLKASQKIRLPFLKVPGTQTANTYYDLWALPGHVQGTAPTAGAGGAVTLDVSNAGAWNRGLQAADTGKGWWLLATDHNRQVAQTNANQYLLMDRLAHGAFAFSGSPPVTTTFSPAIDGTARLATGEGALILVTMQVAASAGVNTFTIDYTDQNGNSATTPSFFNTASAVINRAGVNQTNGGGTVLWVPLAAGDWGARTITAINQTAGTATGTFTIALVKPINVAAAYALGVPYTRNHVRGMSGLMAIHDSACLSMVFIPTANSTAGLAGSFLLGQG